MLTGTELGNDGVIQAAGPIVTGLTRSSVALFLSR